MAGTLLGLALGALLGVLGLGLLLPLLCEAPLLALELLLREAPPLGPLLLPPPR